MFRQLMLRMPRGRHRLIRFLIPHLEDLPPFLSTFDGGAQKFVAALSNRVARTLYFYGTYEPVQTAVFLHVVRPRQTVLDVGANIGYFALLAARRVGEAGRVVAFEPEPANAALLRQNIELNGHRNVAVEEQAVGREAGVVRLAVADANQPDGDVCTTVFAEGGRWKSVKVVPVVGLDGYCAAQRIDRVDVLKLDIEGGEAHAVPGMRDGIRRGVYRRVFLELHPEHLRLLGKTPEDILAEFLDRGYACWRLPNYQEGFLDRYSLRFTDGLLTPYDGTGGGHWPHFLLMAPGVQLADD